MKEILQKIRELSKCLTENNFKKIEEIYDIESFGNEMVVYSSSVLKLRIVKDRGYFYIEALPINSKNDDDWILITRVLEYLKCNSGKKYKEIKMKNEWDRIIGEICANLDLIIDFFNEKNYSDNINKLEKHF